MRIEKYKTLTKGEAQHARRKDRKKVRAQTSETDETAEYAAMEKETALANWKIAYSRGERISMFVKWSEKE